MGYDDLKVTEANKFLVAVAGGERENCSVDDALVGGRGGGRGRALRRRRRLAQGPRRRRHDRGPAGLSVMAEPPRRPTIIDVAARAGVSKSLVSAGHAGDPRVAESSRLRIEETARELGYRTNWAARSPSTLRSGTVGVLVADLHNPWFVEIVDPLRTVLHDAGLDTLLTSAVTPGPRAGSGPAWTPARWRRCGPSRSRGWS